jgi:hypothetical protein
MKRKMSSTNNHNHQILPRKSLRRENAENVKAFLLEKEKEKEKEVQTVDEEIQKIVRFREDPPTSVSLQFTPIASSVVVVDPFDDISVATDLPSFQCAQPRDVDSEEDDVFEKVWPERVVTFDNGTMSLQTMLGDVTAQEHEEDATFFPPRLATSFAPIQLFPFKGCPIPDCLRGRKYPNDFCDFHIPDDGRFKVKKSDIKGAGYGLFAIEEYKEGKFIEGLFFKGKKVDAYGAKFVNGNYLFEVLKDKEYLDMSREKSSSVARYINSSLGVDTCANVDIRPIYVPGKDVEYGAWAICDIKKGAEFLMDYGMDFWQAVIDYRFTYSHQVRKILEKRAVDNEDVCVCGKKKKK